MVGISKSIIPRSIKFIILIVLVLFSGFTSNNIQATDKKVKNLLESESWSRNIKKYNYNENYKSWESKKRDSNYKFPKIFKPFTFGTNLGKIIIWALVIALLGFLLFMLAKNLLKSWNEKVFKSKNSSIHEIEDIQSVDLNSLLNQALLDKQFKLALRFRYLLLLQVLNELHLIIWKKDKTNGSYLIEMFKYPNFEKFKRLTLIFERVWYGDKTFDEKGYFSISPVFKEFQESFKSENNAAR